MVEEKAVFYFSSFMVLRVRRFLIVEVYSDLPLFIYEKNMLNYGH